MSEPAWQEVEVPRGQYIGWGKKGQSVTIRVASYSEDGGRDFNGGPCPQVVGELVEKATSYRARGTEPVSIDRGEFVTITAGQASLAKGLRCAALDPGDLCRVEYVGDYATAKGEGKEFKVYKAKGTGRPSEDEI